MSNTPNPLDALIFGYRIVSLNGGTPVVARTQLNFVGGGVADNPTTASTDITIPESIGLGTAGQVASTNDGAAAIEWRSYLATDVAANVAASGAIRVGENFGTVIAAKYDGASQDAVLLGFYATNQLLFGCDATFSSSTMVDSIAFCAQSTVTFYYGNGGSAAFQYPTANGVSFAIPIALANQSVPGTPTGYSVFFSDANGVPSVIEPSGVVTQLTEISQVLSSDFVSTSSTAAQSTNLTFAMGANDVWHIQFEGNWSLASGTGGAKIAIAIPTGATIQGCAHGELGTGLSTYTSADITAGSTLVGPFNTVSSTLEPIRGFATIEGDGTHSGNVTVQMASVSGVDVTAKAGFSLHGRRAVKV